MQGTQNIHTPVMLGEVIEYLNLKPGSIFLDGTLGLAGHSKEIAKILGSDGRLIGIDRDKQALELAKKDLEQYDCRCDLVQDNFKNIDKVLNNLEIKSLDGILLDLGLSSLQLDNAERGFSIRHNGPIDMRMDQGSKISAFDLINSLSEQEISQILNDFGQEQWHKRIAQKIVLMRAEEPISTTKQLSKIILRAIPRMKARYKIHPATRTFQAFRIAVNRELESLEIVLDKCFDFLNPGGRIGIIAFHSLEDKIVKNKFKVLAGDLKAKIITKKPLRPTDKEVNENLRARSARFRVAERI